MENDTFLIFNKSFWNNEDIKTLTGSSLHFLIMLIYLSFNWKHEPFFQTHAEIYKYFQTYRMDFNRKVKILEKLHVKIEVKDNKVYFDLSDFFIVYNPLRNKSVI